MRAASTRWPYHRRRLTENLPGPPDGLGCDIDLTRGRCRPSSTGCKERRNCRKRDVKVFTSGIAWCWSLRRSGAALTDSLIKQGDETVYQLGAITKGDGVRYHGHLSK